MAKFAEHLPLYRQSEIYARQGVELHRNTMGRWVDIMGEQLRPLYDELKHYVLMPGKVHADDTPVNVLEPGQGKTRTGRLWVYVRDDRNAGSTMPAAVWFSYSPDRKGIHPQQHLADYRGILQADAYAGYNALYESGQVTEAACMAHARRKIHDVHVRHPTTVTGEALRRIGALYAIESEICGSPAEERLAVRKARTVPLMQSLFEWLQGQMSTLSRHSDTAKAFTYLLKQWDALNEYCRNGWVEIDNNLCENALRVTLLDGAARHNVQVLITDSGQRTGTGSALMAMKDAGVNTYRWQGGEQRPATIISEPDRNVRYARLSRTAASSREPEMANRSRQRCWHSGRLKRPSAVKRNAAQMKLSEKWQRTNLTCRMVKQSRLSGKLPGRSVTGLT